MTTPRRMTISEATVRVRADGCGPRTELGVGTSIGDGLVVTAAHVVAGAERVEIVDHLGLRSPPTSCSSIPTSMSPHSDRPPASNLGTASR